MAIWGELRRRNVFKAGAAYALMAWIIAQVISVINEPLNLPDWLDTTVIVLLAVGFPMVLLFAWAYELTPAGLKRTDEVPPDESITHVTGQKLNYILIGLAIGALLGSGSVWLMQQDSDSDWAAQEAVPAIEQHIEAGEWEAAYALAREVERRHPESTDLAALWPRFTRPYAITTDPPGARVFRRRYEADADAPWEDLGVTPIDDARFPIGLMRVRFELAGYQPLLRLFGRAVDVGGAVRQEEIQQVAFKLDTALTLPEGKVRVPGWQADIAGSPIRFDDFFLDRYEVTNAQYKAFVDAGGYQRREFWQHPIIKDGMEISWDEAMTLFVDQTGRPGPAIWEAGNYPDGRGNYPVGGVSWYEAAAYAAFVGAELPTVHHWQQAVNVWLAAWRLPRSNLERASDGPAPVGQFDGVSWVGAYDMTGNVSEWTYNATGDKRYVMGGAWNDPYYIANQVYWQVPIERLEYNGFRLAVTHDEAEFMRRARAELPPPVTVDHFQPQHVSDEVFEVYKSLYAYDARPLDAELEAGTETRHWTRERISFDAAYGDERMMLYLYLPTTGAPPYQTVILVPGTQAWFIDALDKTAFFLDFVVKAGRAVAIPVYQGSLERLDALGISFENWNNPTARERLIHIIQDLGRSIDYLETRADIDKSAFSYFGHSMGSVLAPLGLTMDPRLTTAVLLVGGFSAREPPFLPEIDPGRFLDRVTQPVLMMNGELDSIFPAATHARPFHERLGSRDKKLVFAPGGHFVPRATLVRETLDWLDAHLGPPAKDRS